MITMKELEAPVRQWVPDWLGLISIFVVILPVTMLNGSYTGSMLEVSNTLGTNSEDITMGYYAASAGMAIAYPIIPKVLAAFSVKSLLLIDLILQFFLSWVCARTQNADILIVCSFAVGFLKGFLMLWFIRYAQKIFSRKNVRSEFYSYFYPLVYGGGQASMLVTALLAYYYNWKYMYYFMMMLILIAILFVIICFRHNRPVKAVALSDLHIREMFVISTGLLMLMYVINYGKVLDWMASGKVCAYIIIAPMLIALFIWYQSHSEKPYVSLAPLFQAKAIVGYLYMMLVMFFSTLENVLIVVDDLALPFGTLRLKGKGSDAGHNGLKHIASTLGTQNYARLRFGIGNDFPRGGQIDYVLGHFTDEDWKTMEERLATAGEIIKSFCLAGIDITMNQFNKK